MFDQQDWHWQVIGDTKFWSSKAKAWVDEIGDRPFTRIASTAELNDVLRKWGLAATTPNAGDVRAEAQRRISQLIGATDFNGCIVKQLNANMRATELTNKLAMGEELTAVEQGEAAALHAMAEAIKALRACSNAMESNPPADYASDSHWT